LPINRLRRIRVYASWFLIGDVKPPLGLRSISAADLTRWAGDGGAPAVVRLRSHIEKLIGAPAATAAPGKVTPAKRPHRFVTEWAPAAVRAFGRRWVLVGASLAAVLFAAYLVPKSPSQGASGTAQKEQPANSVPKEALGSQEPKTQQAGPTPKEHATSPATETQSPILASSEHPTSRDAPWQNPRDGLTYVWIPPPAGGTLMMGCSPGDTECYLDEKQQHLEQIANGFWLGRTEVTQKAWKNVISGENPSYFKGDDQLPVENVDWNQATAYCQAIGGRLPTEREWEYAARGGEAGPRYGSLADIAWYGGNSGGKTHPVGSKKHPNAFGLDDMLGNVWEWTDTDWAAYPGSVDACAGCKVVRGVRGTILPGSSGPRSVAGTCRRIRTTMSGSGGGSLNVACAAMPSSPIAAIDGQ
jgi:formylglycine-generating enzyme required for sulfatase activity